MFGYSLDEAIGRSGIDWISESDRKIVTKKLREHDEDPYEVNAKRKDGFEFPVEIRGRMVEHGGERLRVTSIIDISDRRIAEDKLNQGESLLDAIFDSSPDLFFLIQTDGKILEYRARKNATLYVQPSVFLGQRMQDVLPTDVATLFDENITKAIEQNHLMTFEYRLDKDELKRYFEARVNLVPNQDKLIVIIRDISEKKFAESEILRSEIKFRSIFDSSVVAVVVTNKYHEIVEWNAGSERVFGYTFEEAVKLKSTSIIPERLRVEYERSFNKDLDNKPLFESNIVHESLGLRKNGEEFPVALTIGHWRQDGELFINGMILDISKRKKAEDALAYHAHFDSLTSLPNRFLAMDRLNQLLNEVKRNKDKVAVLYLDVDGFKNVNDSLGHESGDRLLLNVAERLSEVVGSDNTVARLDSDKFSVLMPGLKIATDARPVIESIISRFREPFVIESRELLLTISIGVAIYPFDGTTAIELVKNADSAMQYAKNDGGNLYSYFTHSMNVEVARRLSLQEQIHGALERNEFEVVYQAQIDTNSKKIMGAEALLRWQNPVLGFVSPKEFIPIAEQSGLIIKIGMYVLDQALSQLAYWQTEYNKDLKIAVNLSPKQFRDLNLVKRIKGLLDKYQLTTDSLGLEITEGILLGGHAYIEESILLLSESGICIAMDDFGTGYSSLSYLRKYPFNVLKIDQSFVRDILVDTADKELIGATIAMSHALGLKVVAEGVHTDEQLQALKAMNCDFVQGFLFGKPVDAVEFGLQLAK